ncbi:MAG: protein-L-isoaspartate O-methyltransferase [Candidatus Cloacimonetes bacterium 4572_55]|nr:MAG: protein-L-isoaspartate O-methyltransferase [Candidatus Cloacimonetes bacterium 4572_55]
MESSIMSYERQRMEMVKTLIKQYGVRNPRILKAMRETPRHLLAPPHLRSEAYHDHPLSIGRGQTMSQPYMVAYMTEVLKISDTDRILEIGTGSGYQTAILSQMAKWVFSVERIKELSMEAQKNLTEMGYAENISFKVGDGTQGWVEHAPYHVIIVTAGSPRIPAPLEEQLADNGRLVIPVGRRFHQDMTLITKRGHELETTRKIGCVFVPLIGKEGW